MGSVIYPQVVLLGDSITQFGVATWQSDLQSAYIRRADIINRGFGGCTATLALERLRRFLPQSKATADQSPIILITVFFGANDAIAPGVTWPDQEHVALPDFTSAIKEIVMYPVLQTIGAKLLLITPPPINEHQLSKFDYAYGRTAVRTAAYAMAVSDVGQELDVPVLDLWSIFMRRAGWEEADGMKDPKKLIGSAQVQNSEVLEKLLSDGLHLTRAGYVVLFKEMMKLLGQELPELSPENLPCILGEW